MSSSRNLFKHQLSRIVPLRRGEVPGPESNGLLDSDCHHIDSMPYHFNPSGIEICLSTCEVPG